MPTSADLTRTATRRWNRRARCYDLMTAPMERMLGLAGARGPLFAGLKGRVLEVGAGTGKNLRHYGDDAAIVASDLSPGMLGRLRARASASGASRLVAGDVEDLPFRAGAFDAVVASCVFCSVPDPMRGLREIRRVLRDGGQLRLLEHVRPPGLRGRLFDLLDPLATRLMGPHINRTTVESVRRAGFAILRETDLFSDWVKAIVAR